MTLAARLDARAGRAYFAVQAAAGALWWVAVALDPGIRTLTLGDLPAGPVAIADVPLFVFASVLAAIGIRFAAPVVTGWTMLVAVMMAGYATITGLAGWGALLMIAAMIGSLGATLLVQLNRIPSEWLLIGPFRAREAESAPARVHLLRTGAQIVIFWGTCLVVVPAVIAIVEWRWGLRVALPVAVPALGGVLLAAASALGVWSAVTMAGRGDGTPLPIATARRLIVSGPYRFVRNPMAVAGITQGVAVGMLCGSWLVVVYTLCGSLVWNDLIRPWEERDLVDRFGAPYEAYRDRVSCWIPRRPRRASGTARRPLVY
ncbi:isoprenylcysteine carboxylmethyltransferase family protein [Microbacterium sp. ARD32]|uniref:methyltransferase family protein n=1 Tax=Microbacterium sp. ARD32 TaxID=2962577 RepID=UPI00288112A4|nr:isoprenylcysteine carboxylmethyltransferase family protein [Microbacterium sp. ARD32]MDT0157308.1 isoprenylcysteine carboxylmethyltransferase family protein [Microbacterium sp. ARD32]